MAASLRLQETRLYTSTDFAANVAFYLPFGCRIDREEPFMGGTTVYMSKPLAGAPSAGEESS